MQHRSLVNLRSGLRPHVVPLLLLLLLAPASVTAVVDPQLFLCEPGRCLWPDRAPAGQPGLAHLDILLTLDYPIRSGYLEVTLPAGLTFVEPPQFRVTSSTRELLQDEQPAHWVPPFASANSAPAPTTLKLPILTKLPQDWELHFTVNSALLPQQCLDHKALRFDVYTSEGDLVDSTADRSLGVFLHNVPYLLQCIPEPPEGERDGETPERAIANMPRDKFATLNSLGEARPLALTEEDQTDFLTHDERQAELERQRQLQLEQMELQRQREEKELRRQQEEEVLEEAISQQLLAEFHAELGIGDDGLLEASLPGAAGGESDADAGAAARQLERDQEGQAQFDAWRQEE